MTLYPNQRTRRLFRQSDEQHRRSTKDWHHPPKPGHVYQTYACAACGKSHGAMFVCHRMADFWKYPTRTQQESAR